MPYRELSSPQSDPLPKPKPVPWRCRLGLHPSSDVYLTFRGTEREEAELLGHSWHRLDVDMGRKFYVFIDNCLEDGRYTVHHSCCGRKRKGSLGFWQARAVGHWLLARTMVLRAV